MSEFWFAMVLTTMLAGTLIFFGIYRYRYVINPLSFFAIYDIGVITLISVLVTKELNGDKYSAIITVLYLTIIYIAGFFLVFFPRQLRFPRLLFYNLLNIVGKKAASVRYSVLNQIVLVTITLAIFVLLILVSGAGTLWLTNPRMAYLSYRSGVGVLFAMTQWILLVSLLYYFLNRKPRLIGVVIATCIYAFLVYFIGSKANVLSGIIMACVYYNFFIKKISTGWFVLGSFVVFGFFLMLLLLHGSYENVLSAMSYFDYAKNTGEFLTRFDEFGLQYGYGMLSDLWFYVPRGLFPDKPFEYGVTLINKILFPGLAAFGHTPGMLGWSLAYLDFGVVGVFFCGVFAGIVRRGAYELFLSNRGNVFAFVLMIQLSLYPVFTYATLPLIIVIGCFFALFSRKRIVFFRSQENSWDT